MPKTLEEIGKMPVGFEAIKELIVWSKQIQQYEEETYPHLYCQIVLRLAPYLDLMTIEEQVEHRALLKRLNEEFPTPEWRIVYLTYQSSPDGIQVVISRAVNHRQHPDYLQPLSCPECVANPETRIVPLNEIRIPIRKEINYGISEEDGTEQGKMES